jgi:hypothetical protein
VQDLQDTRTNLIVTEKGRGLTAKPSAFFFLWLEARTGRGGGLSGRFTGAPATKKFGRGAKLKEELERNKMVGLPSEERNRGDRYLRSTPAKLAAGSASAGGGARRAGAGRRAGGGAQLGLTRARGVWLTFIGRGQEPQRLRRQWPPRPMGLCGPGRPGRHGRGRIGLSLGLSLIR